MGDSTTRLSSDAATRYLRQEPFPASTNESLIQNDRLTVRSYDDIRRGISWKRLQVIITKGALWEGVYQKCVKAIIDLMIVQTVPWTIDTRDSDSLRTWFEFTRKEWHTRFESDEDLAQTLSMGEEKLPSEQRRAAANGKRPRQSSGDTRPAKRRAKATDGSAPAVAPMSVEWDSSSDDSCAKQSLTYHKYHPDFAITASPGGGPPYHILLVGAFKYDKHEPLDSTHRDGLYQLIPHLQITRSVSGSRLGLLLCGQFFQRFLVLDDDSIAIESNAAGAINSAASSSDSRSTPGGCSPRTLSVLGLESEARFWESCLPNCLFEHDDYDEHIRDRLVHFVAVALLMGTRMDFVPLAKKGDAPLQKLPPAAPGDFSSRPPVHQSVVYPGRRPAEDAFKLRLQYKTKRKEAARRVEDALSLLKGAQDEESSEEEHFNSAGESVGGADGDSVGGADEGLEGGADENPDGGASESRDEGCEEGCDGCDDGCDGCDEGCDGGDDGCDGCDEGCDGCDEGCDGCDGSSGGQGGGGGGGGGEHEIGGISDQADQGTSRGRGGGRRRDDGQPGEGQLAGSAQEVITEGIKMGMGSLQAGDAISHSTSHSRAWAAAVQPSSTSAASVDPPPDGDNVDDGPEPLLGCDAQPNTQLGHSHDARIRIVTPSELDQLVFNLAVGKPVTLEAD